MKHEEGDHVTISLKGHANNGHVGVVHQISPSGEHYGVKDPKTNKHIGYFHSSNLKPHDEELDESTELMEATDLGDGVELRKKESPHRIHHNGESKPAKNYQGKPMSTIQEALNHLRESRNESVEGRNNYSDKAHEAGMTAHKSSVGASNRQQHQAAAKLHGTASGLHGLAAKEYPISDERHAHHYMNAAVHLKASLHHSTAAIGKGTVNEAVGGSRQAFDHPTSKGHPSAVAHKESAKANDQTSICHEDSPPSAHERAAELHKAASAAHKKAMPASGRSGVHLILSRHHDAMTTFHNAAAISASWK